MRALGLTAGLAVLLAAHLPAPAGGDHPPERLDASWAQADRTVTVDRADARRFEATSSLPDGLAPLRFSYDAVATTLRLADGTDPDRRGLTLGLHALVEFQDLDADGRFSLGDPVVQQVRLEGPRYIDVDTQRTPGLLNVTYRYPLPPTFTGNLFVSFLLPENASAVEGRSTAAVHVQVRVRTFAFQEEGTLLALHTRLVSDFGVDVGSVAVESPIDAASVALYAWQPTTADGAPAGVTAQPYGTDGEALVVFAYGHDDDVRHALALGVERLVPPPPDPVAMAPPTVIQGKSKFFVPALGLVLVGVGGTVYWRLRESSDPKARIRGRA